ncbi:MAG: hypothetical protein PUD59_04000 [bacterium]|nr:hypothetical protein [bacterium]
MNNKINVTIVVPKLEEEYDVEIPVSKNVKVSIDLIIKSINELSEGVLPISNNYRLINDEGIILDYNKNIKECGIKNSERLTLI